MGAGLIILFETDIFHVPESRNEQTFVDLLAFPTGHINLLDVTEVAVRGSKELGVGLPIAMTG